MQNNLRKILEFLMAAVILLLSYYLPGKCLEMADMELVRESMAEGGSREAENKEEGNKEEENKEDAGNGKMENGAVDDNTAGGTSGIILIDPGHGGDDPGMVGIDGIKEKTLNLKIAQKLANLLEQKGYTVVLTREEDAGLYEEGTANHKAQDMQRRCALIEEHKPLVTVSIHQNSYTDAAVYGPQVFYFEHSPEGEKLAACIQTQMNTLLEIERPRSIKANLNYYILKRSPSVTALVECGFLSNPGDVSKLITEEYQDRVAEAVCAGILEYLQ
ncbi:MAG: N-acetylmuramoyl-L-alanine amidase [Lachnospiraceae bacterium]|nr:N-acetylmuramoyl-L-alanine amidase [Lachnospiraceae bacterium]